MKHKNLTIAEALPIAERHIASVINNSERLREYEFSPVSFRREADRYWGFSAGSKQLQDEGYVPGAISACVDKVDGHIWSHKEQERYAQSISPYPPPPKPVSPEGKEMMDIEDGAVIARRALAEIINSSAELRGYKFSRGRLHYWNDRCWVFSAACEQLGGEGSARGEVFVSIDPYDGHILSAEEEARLAPRREPVNQTLQPESAAA
jgi:hypothetical protein